MTPETLPLMFLGAGLVTLGLLALMAGFFLGLLAPGDRARKGSAVFLIGIVAVITGAWLMRATQ